MTQPYPDTFTAAPPTKRELALLAGVVAAAALLRFATLDLQSFDHDEAVTAGRVLVPDLFHTLKHVADGERSPPLYYLLAWLWSRVFGTGEVGLRSLSALIGTLTVPAAWLAGRQLASPRVGLWTASFVALNPYLIWYSQEARSYALMVLFLTLGLAFFARSLTDGDTSSLSLWALTSALAVCSHYFAAFLVAPQAIWLLWTLKRSRRHVLVRVSAVAVIGLFLVPLAINQEGTGRRNGFTDIPLASRVAELPVKFMAGEQPDPLAGTAAVDAVQIGAATAGGVLFVCALVLLYKRGSPYEKSRAFLASFVAACALVLPTLLALAGIDFLNPRNLLGGLVPLLVLGASGFAARRTGWLGAGCATAACLLFLAVDVAVLESAQMHRPDWRAAANAIGATHHTRIIVTNANGDTALDYYLPARTYRPSRFPRPVRTRQIDALATNYKVTPPPGFRLVSRQSVPPLFILDRFVAPHSRAIRLSTLAGHSVLTERSEILVQKPSR